MYSLCLTDDPNTADELHYALGIADSCGSCTILSAACDLSSYTGPVELAIVDADTAGNRLVSIVSTLRERFPLCNFIFVSAYKQYMPDAFELHASGYILRPVTPEKLSEEIIHRRYRSPDLAEKRIRVQCFGNFEIFADGRPLTFKRKKSKELLAFLIHCKGAMCNMDMIIGNIEPEMPFDESAKAKIRVYIGDLMVTCMRFHISELIVKAPGTIGIDTSLVDCDYYRYLEGDPFVISRFTGEYMMQYSFSEETKAFLEMKYLRQHGKT